MNTKLDSQIYQVEQTSVGAWLTGPTGRPLNHMLPNWFGKIGWAARPQLAWRRESSFWRNIVLLCPDIDLGTEILVKGNWPRQEHAILSNSWAGPDQGTVPGLSFPLKSKRLEPGKIGLSTLGELLRQARFSKVDVTTFMLFSSFAAALMWRFSDSLWSVDQIVSGNLGIGLLLLAIATP